MDCLFCQIVAKKIPAKIVWENGQILAFADIAPVAPVHILVIPKKHIQSLYHVEANDVQLMGDIMTSIRALADQLGVAKNGFRVQTNIGKDGGQVVPHLHFHLMGGKALN